MQELYRELDAPARDAGVAVVPAMAFYGGLADLLVTAALDGDSRADEVEVAIGLDRWWPTDGTRATGARNTATRQVIRDGVLAPLAEPRADRDAGPTRSRSATSRSCSCRSPRSSRSTVTSTSASSAPTSTPPRSTTSATPRLRRRPRPTRRGRSAQQFVVDVVVRRGSDTRRISGAGRDIYAVTAPIVVEGAVRLLDGRHRGPGAMAPGEAFDAGDVLAALERDTDGLAVRRDWPSPRGSASELHGARVHLGPGRPAPTSRRVDASWAADGRPLTVVSPHERWDRPERQCHVQRAVVRHHRSHLHRDPAH